VHPTFPTAADSTNTSEATASIEVRKDGDEDHPDNRSSSLSELGDASDVHDEPTPRPLVPTDFAENDSEAETERLDTTPRKLTRAPTDFSIASDHTFTRTPSKLVQSNTLNENILDPPSPLAATAPSVGDPADGEAGLDALSLAATAEIANIAELAGRKRKRSSAENSSVDEPAGAPARKRSSTAKTATINGNQALMNDSAEQSNLEEELDHAEERISELAQEDIELESQQADIAAETVGELTTVARLTKPKRGGGRKGKRKVDDTGDTASEILVPADTVDGEPEADNDDEDGGAVDEEATKKKAAIETLSKIEKKFRIFREKLCDEQIAQCERELEMLKQPNCVHPEYLNMVKCIDERRAEKISYEKTLLAYKMKGLEIRTIAERQQMHSQYIQAVRELRERSLSECNQRVYELQRGRRQLGVEEVDYSFKFPEKRSEQIRQQAAYNLEVSILSGIAKHVGFPAAPEMAAARPSDIDDDLRAMKIPTRAPAPAPFVRQYNRTSTADEAAAEEQFIERTPWANPHHPAHHQAHYHAVAGPSRPPNQNYHTPAGQRRVDVHVPNGSASTIDNTPSSAQGPPYADAHLRDSESPVLRMKRIPSEHRLPSETPGSQPRNFAALAHEPYPGGHHMGSSPAVGHVEPLHHDHETQGTPLGARWSGSGGRPINAGPQPIPAPLPGRPEAGRVPITQRASLGAVSVGSGGGLFGR
jgi:NACalpha-BTF3-like transcription factor